MRRTPLLFALTILLALAPAGARAASKIKPPGDGKPFTAYLVKVSGTTLMVSISSGNAGAEVLVPTDDQTVFTLEGEPAKLADLKPPMALRIVQEEGLTKTVDAKAAKGRK
ncbi:MAG: hypothetical protein ACAI43_08390 [Phycisphaerae bacterium]|nr:hypothetical protein [Tepidisphaeraceae bacterium]